WDPAQIDPAAVRLAFQIARKLGTQSIAVDVLRRNGGELVINEISYYYEGWAIEKCPGHWRMAVDEENALQWVDGQVRPEDAILDDFITSLDRSARKAVRATVFAEAINTPELSS